MPVWSALSEFFLDTSHDRDDREHIAAALAASHYSRRELEYIFVAEVRRALWPELLSIAPEWSGYPPEFLRRRILRRVGTPVVPRFFSPVTAVLIFLYRLDPTVGATFRRAQAMRQRAAA